MLVAAVTQTAPRPFCSAPAAAGRRRMQLEQICDYADSFREQIKQLQADRASQNEALAGGSVELSATPKVLPDNGDHFAIGGVIDGERDRLPA